MIVDDVMPRNAVSGTQLFNHIAGEWSEPSGAGVLIDLDPAEPSTPLLECASSSPEAAAAVRTGAAAAQPEWGRSTIIARAQIFLTAAGIFRERVEPTAALISIEEGKPIAEARAEVIRTAETLEALAAVAYAPQ